MDNAENWSANLQGDSINTFNVIVHELGHGLGLQHAKSNDNIMAPFYNAIEESKVDLGPWEKWAIQANYGARTCNRTLAAVMHLSIACRLIIEDMAFVRHC